MDFSLHGFPVSGDSLRPHRRTAAKTEFNHLPPSAVPHCLLIQFLALLNRAMWSLPPLPRLDENELATNRPSCLPLSEAFARDPKQCTPHFLCHGSWVFHLAVHLDNLLVITGDLIQDFNSLVRVLELSNLECSLVFCRSSV